MFFFPSKHIYTSWVHKLLVILHTGVHTSLCWVWLKSWHAEEIKQFHLLRIIPTVKTLTLVRSFNKVLTQKNALQVCHHALVFQHPLAAAVTVFTLFRNVPAAPVCTVSGGKVTDCCEAFNEVASDLSGARSHLYDSCSYASGSGDSGVSMLLSTLTTSLCSGISVPTAVLLSEGIRVFSSAFKFSLCIPAK